MTTRMKAVLWFVVLIGLGAVVGAVVIGVMHRDVEVEEKPYEASLHYDADAKRTSDYGWRTGVFIVMRKADEADVRLVIRNREGKPVSLRAEDIGMTATRPAGDLKDVQCKTSLAGEGEIKGDCSPLAFGHWEFVTTINTTKGPVKLVERTYVEKKSP